MSGRVSVNITASNYVVYVEGLLTLLSKDLFNMVTVSNGLVVNKPMMRLKFCNRQVGANLKAADGQVSISLFPGGSIAWDLNVERVVIHFEDNGDIVIERLFEKDKWKRILCTRNLI